MSVREFCGRLNEAKLGKNDKKWFPTWLRRYASTVESVDGMLSVTEREVIAFSRSLLASDTPAYQRLQAVRAVEAYRNLVLKTGQPPLDHIRKKPSRLAAQERQDRPGVEDERHSIGQNDPREPQIIQPMRKELRRHHRALTTERSYIGWAQRFVGHCQSADLELFGEPEIKAFLTDLAVTGNVTAGTQDQAKHAFRQGRQGPDNRVAGLLAAIADRTDRKGTSSTPA